MTAQPVFQKCWESLTHLYAMGRSMKSEILVNQPDGLSA